MNTEVSEEALLAAAEEDEELDEVEDDAEEDEIDAEALARLRKERWIAILTRLLIYARYLLPVVSVITVLIFGFFDHVYFFMEGDLCYNSLYNFYHETIAHAHEFWMSGTADAQKEWLYGMLIGGVTVGLLAYLAAAFFAVWGAVTSMIAFHFGHESEQSNRMKVRFKILFPNRVCLLLSNLILVIPTLFPFYYAWLDQQLLTASAGIYVENNIPLTVASLLVLLTALLALLILRLERQKKMNMFLVWHPAEGELPTDDEAEEDDEDEEEYDEE